MVTYCLPYDKMLVDVVRRLSQNEDGFSSDCVDRWLNVMGLLRCKFCVLSHASKKRLFDHVGSSHLCLRLQYDMGLLRKEVNVWQKARSASCCQPSTSTLYSR